MKRAKLTLNRHIAYCWLRGFTIRETRQSVQHCMRQQVDFEQVRQRFIILADEYLGVARRPTQ